MRGNESVYLFRLTITLHSTQVMDRNDVLAFTKKGNDSYIPDTFLELGKKSSNILTLTEIIVLRFRQI